ncbi:hypothetical protein O6P43_017104 [Quillaja saponaria]|uniref:Uncharacterized protein n=1 Tax=Quillaja saponaria TaxID=32244 RepID=A0AAD7PN92_QUISA|nr:hypothetical protein O6P43_017104 [Quillaja saponaria]
MVTPTTHVNLDSGVRRSSSSRPARHILGLTGRGRGSASSVLDSTEPTTHVQVTPIAVVPDPYTSPPSASMLPPCRDETVVKSVTQLNTSTHGTTNPNVTITHIDTESLLHVDSIDMHYDIDGENHYDGGGLPIQEGVSQVTQVRRGRKWDNLPPRKNPTRKRNAPNCGTHD